MQYRALSRLGLSRGFELRVQGTQATNQDTAALVAKRNRANTLLWYLYVSQEDRS
jgi:NAD(P)H-nitrite reductase large subunit